MVIFYMGPVSIGFFYYPFQGSTLHTVYNWLQELDKNAISYNSTQFCVSGCPSHYCLICYLNNILDMYSVIYKSSHFVLKVSFSHDRQDNITDFERAMILCVWLAGWSVLKMCTIYCCITMKRSQMWWY